MNIDCVVKVGGSLYDLPNLGPRLAGWLKELKAAKLVLVPGGGPTADLVRAWDRQHGLGEERSHWLALRALTFNAHFLATILPGSRVIQNLEEARPGEIAILDMHAWAKMVDRRPGGFPHIWDVTSDSLTVQVSSLGKAAQLILLKSVDLPPGIDWSGAARRGIVDGFFPEAINRATGNLSARIVNFRHVQGR